MKIGSTHYVAIGSFGGKSKGQSNPGLAQQIIKKQLDIS